MNKTINSLEMSSVYTYEEGIWWLTRQHYPEKVEYNAFTCFEDKWNELIDKEFVAINTTYRMKSNDSKLKLRSYIGALRTDPNVIISCRISNEAGKGRVEIHGFTVLWSRYYTPNFDPTKFDEIFEGIKIAEERKSKVYMVIQGSHGLDLQSFDIDIPVLDMELNYGKDWAAKHELLLESLTIKKKKGIALLHGLPGTGKSMYIRNLISVLSENRTVVYLPNQLINNITDPGFIPLMAEYSGSILVIEDADEAIKSRKSGGGIVDKLLNLSDGILSDFLGMQIICTFNNDLSSIDDALLRKGRLILKHEFGKLDVKAAQELSNRLGFKTEINTEMTLAEIYNQDDVLNADEPKSTQKIGFGR